MSDNSVKTVGSELCDEIERVAMKRERWLGYQRALGSPSGAGLGPGIELMRRAIEAGKLAIRDDDVIAGIEALENLRGFDSTD